MIESIRFRKKVRDVFAKGETLELRQLTVLAGDNGSGKSTLLSMLAGGQVSRRGRAPGGTVMLDFESCNPRTGRDAGTYGVFSRLSMSHGETTMDLVCNGLDARDSLVLLDEPDLGLSPRSCRRLWDVVSGLVDGKGCQVVMACHSPVVLELAGEVLDMESRRWMGWREFMEAQKVPRPLRWVDGRGTERMDVAVRMVVEHGGKSIVGWYTGSSMYGRPWWVVPFSESEAGAMRFRKRERAESLASWLQGRRFRVLDGYAVCVSAEVSEIEKMY